MTARATRINIHFRAGREAPLATMVARSSDESCDVMEWDKCEEADLGPAAAEGFVELDVSDGPVGADGEKAVFEAEQRALGIEEG